jgi:diphthamide biosynthesis methyltransferase
MDLGLHTLCLVDIKVKEQTEENLMRYLHFSGCLTRRVNQLTIQGHTQRTKDL